MKLVLPYSKNKRYLTGMDWVIGALNRMSRNRTGGSNASQLVLELRGPFDDAKFRAAVLAFAEQLPVLGGRVTRDWNGAPCWKMPRAGSALPVPVEIRTVTEAGLMAALEASVNTCFARPDEHVALRLFHVHQDRHFAVLHFDHVLFDAYGAEVFLDLFQRWQQGDDCQAELKKIALTEPAHLCAWRRKFDAGRQFVRKLRELAVRAPRILPRPASLKGRRFCFRVMEFNAAEAHAIHEQANQEAGFLMFMPYVLATAVQALDKLFGVKAAVGQDYVVSVSIDLRAPDTAASHLFFNHLSFLLFRIPGACAGDRKQVLELVRTQMYEQVKNGFPQALAESSMLMRILPLPLLSWALLRPLGGEFASFGFSCSGKSGYRAKQFMDAEVVNLFHMPMIPVPPGVGLVVNQHGPRMNVVFSYLEGLLTTDDALALCAEMRRSL